MWKTKGFGYHTEKDKDVINHIDKQPNKSQYIWNLVRQDMDKENSKLEKLIKTYVEKILKDKDIKINDKKTSINKKDVMNLLHLGKK